MFYSQSTGGFYSADIHGDGIPPDAMPITLEEHARLLDAQARGQLITADADGRPIAVNQPSPEGPIPPRQVSMRQARLALLASGHLAQVDGFITALPTEQQDAVRIEWEYAATVERDSPLVTLLGQSLSLDADALDALFIDAAAR